MLALCVGPLLASPAAADVKVSDRAYVRADGGTDPTIAACSVNNRQQNEPAASVAPHNPQLMTAGANDSCAGATTGGDTWAGFYYSADGGQTWTNSLVPGYPTDTSAEGQASPLFARRFNHFADPAQAWDNAGHLYYAGAASRGPDSPNLSFWVARYDWLSGPSPDYRHTTVVAQTPNPSGGGLVHHKPQIEVDRGADSPHEGNVYVCWTRSTRSGSNSAVYLSRSTDQGRTFTHTRISDSAHGNQFCDVAVTRDGSVHAAWRQFEFDAENGQTQDNAVAWVKSTNGGRSFTRPQVATPFVAWEPTDRPVSATGSPRNCGDGAFLCQSGYVFSRGSSQVRITADPTASGNPDEVFMVYDGSVPGSLTATGTTYGTVGSGTGSQSAVYFLRTSDGGNSWSAPQRLDAQAVGHQIFPDIAADSGRLHAVWQDSRADTASGPSGGDFRTVPISNRWVSANPPGAVSTGTGLHSFYATSTNSGANWTVSQVSTQSTMPQYEQFFDTDLPFFGDYNYIAASGTTVLMAWTDQRDTVPGIDPRYQEDGMDGFDVHQCRMQSPDGTWGPDTCPDVGGRDQNIYGAVMP